MFSTSLQRLGPTFPQRFKDVICPLGINNKWKLELVMSGMQYLKPLYFDEDSLGCEGINKYTFLKSISFSFDIHMLNYDP